MKVETNTSVKRFGARYGRRVKLRYGEVEKLQKALNKCPTCGYKKAKHVSIGIFICTKCSAKFTGKAFTL